MTFHIVAFKAILVLMPYGQRMVVMHSLPSYGLKVSTPRGSTCSRIRSLEVVPLAGTWRFLSQNDQLATHNSRQLRNVEPGCFQQTWSLAGMLEA
jgi:hypothetical protein